MSLHDILKQLETESNLALYVHIPFCRFMCHYCDFAKTANFDGDLIKRYMDALAFHAQAWLKITGAPHVHPLFNSVFFGGGTPSLLGQEYTPLMETIRAHLTPHAEVTLEANPDDLSDGKIGLWRELGFNRLSVGVQSFDPMGLSFLKRTHRAQDVYDGLKRVSRVFNRLNIDLIYGWPGQTWQMWRDDLKEAVALPIDHLSLYHLTYEPRTPIGRAYGRGLINPVSDEQVTDYYEFACDFLASQGFVQYEVSNWCKPGRHCKQNINYWSGASYLGIGSGAHGYLADRGRWGMRYHYPRRERSLRVAERQLGDFQNEDSWESFLGVEIEGNRDGQAWLLERLGSSLRTSLGFNVTEAEKILGKKWEDPPFFSELLAEGRIFWRSTGGERFIVLPPSQWFLEHSWAQLVLSAWKEVSTDPLLAERLGTSRA